MRALLGLILLVLVIVYAAFVVTSNNQQINIHLLFTTIQDVPLWQGLLGAFILGAFVTGVGCTWSILRLRLRERRQSREIGRLEQEIHGLRTLPLEVGSTPADASAQKG